MYICMYTFWNDDSNVCLCWFSYSNCTGRGREWPCCVPNYLRTFPKIATETSLHVRLFPSRCLQIQKPSNSFSHIFYLLFAFCSPSWGRNSFLLLFILPLAMRAVLPPFVVSLSPSADDATRVILKSTDDYINANYINVSWLLLCSLFHLSVSISVPRLRPGGWSAVRTLKTHVETLRWPQWWMNGPHQPCKQISHGVKCVSQFKLTGACEFGEAVLLGENTSFLLI